MTYTYTTGSRRRLVLGPPHAPARLCVPIPPEVYDALGALHEQEQESVVWTLGEVLKHLLADTWDTPLGHAARTAYEPGPEQDAQRQLDDLEDEGLAAQERQEREEPTVEREEPA